MADVDITELIDLEAQRVAGVTNPANGTHFLVMKSEADAADTDDEDEVARCALERAGLKPTTDNRIAPNLFLLTGLERQNRNEFKAFPIGEEDGLKAEIASALFKDAIKRSNYGYKSSDQFKDGITCGEAHLELYLDFSEDLLNGLPCWRKCDGAALIADPASREYDFTDARYVYKVTLDVERGEIGRVVDHGRYLTAHSRSAPAIATFAATSIAARAAPCVASAPTRTNGTGCVRLPVRVRFGLCPTISWPSITR